MTDDIGQGVNSFRFLFASFLLGSEKAGFWPDTAPNLITLYNCPQNSDRVQVRFQSHNQCIMKHQQNTELYSTEFQKTQTSDPSDYRREYLPDGSYSLFQFERSDVISVQFCFFYRCLIKL